LHQRVLKGVCGIRRRPASEYQLRADELLQSDLQPRRRHVGDSTDEFVGELTPERRCNLHHFSRGRQSIEPGQERGLERRRDRQMVSGAGHPSAFDN
jgi:hypothetical protein